MAGDDGLSDVVDWGDGDEDEQPPPETAESQVGGVDADAISLASDGDDIETLKKYHDQTWRDPSTSRVAHVPSGAPEPVVEPSIPAAEQPAAPRNTQETNINQSGKATPLNIPGLPPKPLSPVFTRGPAATVSMSATAMAPREVRPNGNHKSGEEREPSRLPPGWERRSSRKGETYYYDTVAGTTQWDYPAPAKSSSRSQADSREDNGRRDKENVGSTRDAPPSSRRSRSRERRAARRSPSPRQAMPRPRSRSLDRSYRRPARAPSPGREPGRAVRESNHARRSPLPPRERAISPRPYVRSDARARSPLPSREDNESYRRDRRQEPLQSSRHRSPPPRNHSQERSSYRSSAAPKDRMEIDHYEPPSHSSAVRRRRSWDAMDTSDSKRRRVDISPPPASRGIDRYVPDRGKTSRMDVDSPRPRQESSRAPMIETQLAREKSHRDPPPHVRSRDANGGTASDREPPSASLLPKRFPPPDVRNPGSQQAPVTQRSKAPLPPQSAAMRMGHQDRPRPAPMDIDNNRAGGRPSNSDAAPTGPRANRKSGNHPPDGVEPTRDRSPHGRPHRDELGPSRVETSKRADQGVDRARRADHILDSTRDQVNGFSSDHGWSRSLPPSDGYGDSHRGRGRSSRQATSGSNNIPISQPKGRFGQSSTREDSAPRSIEHEQATVRPIDSSSELQQNDPNPPKKPRQSRFGPPAVPAVVPAKPEDPLQVEKQPSPLNEDPHLANQSKNTLQNVDAPIQSHEEIEESQDEAVRAVEQEGKREVPHIRINRDRVPVDVPHPNSSNPHADAAPTTSTQPPYDDGGFSMDNSDGKHVQPSVDTQPDLPADSEEPSNQSAKPEPVHQHSLLDRLAPGPRNGPAAATGDDGYGDYAGGDRGRGRRGRRSGRGPRR